VSLDEPLAGGLGPRRHFSDYMTGNDYFMGTKQFREERTKELVDRFGPKAAKSR
jgi:hypothetical protein